MKYKRVGMLLFFLLLPVVSSAVESADLVNINVSTYDDYSRITLSLDKQTDYTLTHYSSKNLLVIILPDAKVDSLERDFEVQNSYVQDLVLKEVPGGVEISIKMGENNQYRCSVVPGSTNLIIDIGLISPEVASEVTAWKDEYMVSSQDVLKITVYEHEDLTQTVKVSSAGYITFPLLGKVKVSDLSARQVEEKLEQLLGEKYLVNPRVMVYVSESANIYILGEVEKPGVYKLRANLTVVEAITMAGGFTKTAYRNKTKVIRNVGNRKETIGVPVGDIIKRGDKRKDPKLEAGDVIIVPESFF